MSVPIINSLTSNIYPFDTTGLATTNNISNEQHTAQQFGYLNEFLVVADYAPFFGNSLIVTYTDAVTPVKILVEGIDYKKVLPYFAASRSIGLPIYGGIMLLNSTPTGTVALQYQTLGGQWCPDINYVYTIITEEIYDPRSVVWDVLTNIQEVFPNINNSLIIDTTYGVSSLVDSLSNLAVAINASPTQISFQGIGFPNNIVTTPVNTNPTVIVTSTVISTPSIVSPVNGATNEPQSLTLQTSPFALTSGTDTQALASWELATDSGFANIVQSSLNSNHNLNSWTIYGLANSKQYFARVMFTSVSGATSQWSNSISFTTIAAAVTVTTPSIISPITGTTGEALSLSISASAFALNSGTDTQGTASWELASDSAFTHIIQSSINSSINLATWNIAGLSNSTTYYARVMYSSSTGVVSQWSNSIYFTTLAATVVIAAPSITSPINGTINETQSLILTSSLFALTSGIDTQASASWEVATDSGFTNIVQSSLNSTANLTSWSIAGLANSTTYYTRVKHTGITGITSPWSNVISFTTIAATIVITTPAITSPLTGVTGEALSFTLTSSAFALFSGADTLANSSWEISTDSSFTNIVKSSMNSPTNLTSWTVAGLSNSTTYYARMMYTGTSGVTSQWSNAIYFTTVVAPISIVTPSIISPASGSTGIAINFTASSTAFTLASGNDTQASASWELATDSGFTNIVQSSLNDTVNLTSWPITGLINSKVYYIRVMYTGTSGYSSPWSSVDFFTTIPAPIIVITPSIVNPVTGTTGESISFTMSTTAFSLSSGIDTQGSASWEIATDSGFTNIVQSNINSIIDLNNWPVSGLAYSTLYYARVMFTSTSGSVSSWSIPIDFTTALPPVIVATPSITSPISGSIGDAISFTMSASAFTLTSGADTQAASNWEIASDSGFTNIVQSSMNSATNLTSWPVSGLAYSTTYYARVMYITTTGKTSSWSTTDSFTTMAPPIIINAPNIISPVNGATGVSTSPSFTSDAFSLSSGTDTESSASWELATDSAFTNIVQSSLNSTLYLTNWTISGLAYNTLYYTRVMYTGASGKTSPWSTTIGFTTILPPIIIATPSVTSPTNGSTGNTLSLTAASTPFTLSSGTDTAASADWQVATDSGFSNLIAIDSGNTTNLTSWPVSGLAYSTTYYIRVMYTGVSGKTSPWSSTLYFTTKADPVLGIGVFGGGYTTGPLSTTSIYTYSSNTAIAGGNLSYVVAGPAAAGNSSIGVFGAGYSATYLSTTSIYTYSSNTAIAGGNLSYRAYLLAACGPNLGVNA